MDLLGRSNPWAKDWSCDRKECQICKGRCLLAEEEEARPLPEPGKPPLPRPGKEETQAMPKCTTESVGYSIECWTCRLRGRRMQYIGESSRSGYQRGREHAREMETGRKTHPLVIHWEEEHGNQPQETLMRILTTTDTALQRQTWESVRIDELARKNREGCLNLKTEWGLSKNPSLLTRARPPVH